MAGIARQTSVQSEVITSFFLPVFFRGLVRISCPNGLLQGRVADLLARFLSKHPHVRIALDATNRCVDVSTDRISAQPRQQRQVSEETGRARAAPGRSR
jgi:DNA-binding transcriptional LysR family regulator